MSQDWGKRSESDGEHGIVSGGGAERYYMNKSYGRSLERARALDARPSGQTGGEFRRATIEPEAGGGHKVIVEHSTTVIGDGRDGQQAESSERSFAKPEDAIQFLQEILHGRLPGEVESGNHGEAGRGSAPEDDRNEGNGSWTEDLI
jgi:hypothetical protein